MTGSIRPRTTRLTFAVVSLLVFYVVGVIVRNQFGVRVIVSNESGEALRQVSLKVETRGKRYSLPDFAAGQHRRVFVEPVGESHINLEFLDARNKVHSELVVGYVETGYCGTAKAVILPEGRVESTDFIPELVCWKGWLGFTS